MKFTEAEICLALANWSELFRQQCCIPNVSWGIYTNHECDMVSFTHSGVVTEYEIKTTWSDWKNDWTKDRWAETDRHGNPRRVMPKNISRYYYVVPKDVYDGHHDEVKLPIPEAGIVTYTRNHYGQIRFSFVKKAMAIPGSVKIDKDTMYRFARLGVMRYWTRLITMNHLIANYKIKSRTVIPVGGEKCRMLDDGLCRATGTQCRQQCNSGITLVSEQGRKDDA